MTTSTTSGRPPSATSGAVAAAGLVTLMLGLAAMRVAATTGHAPPIIPAALALLIATAAAFFAADAATRPWTRLSAGLDWSRNTPSASRALTKYLGFAFVVAVFSFSYSAFPEYAGSLYARWRTALGLMVPATLAVGIPYIFLVDAHMIEPCDGLWNMGMAVRLRFTEVNRAALRQFLLGCVVKGFFLPLMFSYLCNDVAHVLDPAWGKSMAAWDLGSRLLYAVDVVLATVGYLFALRLFDTHIRSTEPTAGGWLVALACYDPFWGVVGAHYLAYGAASPGWEKMVSGHPVLAATWGAAILILVGIYVWATAAFGCRFSNLTHRGIITSGPYRWVKHPAYLSKNLSWWLVSAPFFATTPRHAAIGSLLLAGLNGIYLLRAITEERHLSIDPTYQAYSAWIAQHGAVARLRALVRASGDKKHDGRNVCPDIKSK